MQVIYITFTLICVLFLRVNDSSKFNDRFLCKTLTFFIVFIIFFTIKYNLPVLEGTDQFRYHSIYERWLNSGVISEYIASKEFGFYYLLKVLAYFGWSSNTAFSFIYTLSIILLLYSINSGKKVTSFFLLCFMFSGHAFWMMNGIRQSIAIVFFYFSILSLTKEDNVKFFLYLLIGATFHYSIIFCVFIPFLLRMNISKKALAISYVISLLCLLIPNPVSALLSQSIEFILSILPGVLSQYSVYSESDKLMMSETVTNSGVGVFLHAISVVLMIYLYTRVLQQKEQLRYTCIFTIFFIGEIAANLFFGIEVLARALRYAESLQPLIMAIIFSYSYKRYDKILCLIIFMLSLPPLYINLIRYS